MEIARETGWHGGQAFALAQQPEKLMGVVASNYSAFLRVYVQAMVENSRISKAEETLQTAEQMMERQHVWAELWLIKAGLRQVYQAGIRPSLNITVNTVESHINRIFLKLGFTSRTQIVVWAFEERLREP